MGAMGGFMSGLMEQIGPELDRHRADADQIREDKRALLLKSLHRPDISPGEADAALAELEKMYSHAKPAKELLGRVRGVMGKLGQRMQGAPKASPAGQLPPPQLPSQQSQQGTADAPTMNQAPTQPRHQALPPPVLPSQSKKKDSFDYAGQVVKNAQYPAQAEREAFTRKRQQAIEALGLSEDQSQWTPVDRQNVAEATLGKNLYSNPSAASTRIQSRKDVARPGLDENGKPYTGFWDVTTDPTGKETWAQRQEKTSHAAPRQGDYVLGETVKSMIAQGIPIHGPNGQPATAADVEAMADNATYRWWVVNGNFTFLPVDVKDTKTNLAGNVVAHSPFDTDKIGEGAGVVLGPAQGAKQTDRVIVTTDPKTQQQIVNRVPAMSRPVPGPVPGHSTAAPQQPAQSQAPRSQVLPGVASGQFSATRNRVTNVREAKEQILGDPAHGNSGLGAFADLASDPGAQARLQKAFKIMLNDWDGVAKSGTFTELVKNEAGITAALAASQAKIQGDAMKALEGHPREESYFTQMMPAMSVVMGLRSLSGQPAAMFTSEALKRELPLIGISAVNARTYNEKMSRLAGIIANGYKNTNTAFFDEGERKRVEDAPAEFQKRAEQTPINGLSGPTTRPTIKTQAEFDKLPKGAEFVEDGKVYRKK